MNAGTRLLRTMVLFAACLAAVYPAQAQSAVYQDNALEPPHLLHDLRIEEYRLELLDLAFEAASSFPLNPHIKNRARAEEKVVLGALACDQPHRAWGYAKKVVNWRRGACYAEVGHYLLERGEAEHVPYFMQQALLHSIDPEQGWRHQRVRARVEQTRLMLGEAEEEGSLIVEEDAQSDAERMLAASGVVGDEAFEDLVAQIDRLLELQDYDATKGALHAYVRLFDRFYDQPERRALIGEKLRSAWVQMPGWLRFELLLDCADSAMSHDDFEHARALVDEAAQTKASFRWTLDFDLPMRAELAKYYVRVGDPTGAVEILEASLAFAEDELENLENYKRAATMRPIAEAYALLGEGDTAHALYAEIVALGVVNPNIRPRVNDATETCVSMAVYGVQPDQALLAEIKRIVSGLGQ